ncbi:MAG: acetyl-CoA carboxylase carboxyltransferase subunit alpha [Planctomycetes bacterium]|nr:acetyl-CoA carboxylase carboxyltransferase subunit alpha [Planctomycetota bacterium]
MSEFKAADKLEFEAPVFSLDKEIYELEYKQNRGAGDFTNKIKELKAQREKKLTEIYKNLSPWEKVLVSRFPGRPGAEDYIDLLLRDKFELYGDRAFGDDPAIATVFGYLDDRRILIVAHRKGKTLRDRIACNFGCAHPEGYRKAMHKMKIAEKFNISILTLINTPGAYPGIGAEERGQAMAIAENMRFMASLNVPIINLVIGEGGSGGALGIGVGDKSLCMSNSYYSVISPEGCASILWKDSAKAPDAAKALKLTPENLLKMGLIDGIVKEPVGGAHRYPEKAINAARKLLHTTFDELQKLDIEKLKANRYEKIRKFGKWTETSKTS